MGKAVGVKLTSESLEVQAQVDKLSYKAGDKGRLLVGLLITKGHSLGGEGREATLIEVTAPGGVTVTKVETRIPGTLNERRKVLAIEFVVGEGAASGELDVSVSFQARGGKADGPQAIALRVPIAISVPAAGRALPKKLHGTWRSADGKVYVFSANGYEGDGASGRAELLGTEGAVLRLRLQRRGAEELWEIKLDGDTFTMSKPWSGQSFRRRDR